MKNENNQQTEPSYLEGGFSSLDKSPGITIKYSWILKAVAFLIIILTGAIFSSTILNLTPGGSLLFGKQISGADKARILKMEEKFGESYSVVLDDIIKYGANTVDISAVGGQIKATEEKQANTEGDE